MSRIHILLVEDNPGDVLLVRESLDEQKLEHELHVATDGEMALKFLSEMGEPAGLPCPDLLLLDLNLPKTDGPTVLQEFRKHAACMRTPVIVITSSETLKERAQLTALGISHYFRKPSNFTAFMQLGSIIRRLLDEEEQRAVKETN